MGKSILPDLNTIMSAGFDPKTGLPIKWGDPTCALKADIKRALRIKDCQEAKRRFVWYNLPSGLTGDLVEHILYYRAQGALFYIEATDKFYFLPYTLADKGDGGIDCYSRFKEITPVQMGAADGKEKPLVAGLTRTPVYSFEDLIDKGIDPYTQCVILRDYSNQFSQVNIPRQIINDSILDAMAECFPLSRTNLFANSGIKGIRVESDDEDASVMAANGVVQSAALNGRMFIGIQGTSEMEDITASGTATKTEEFLQHMQALDNFRLSLYGLKNSGLFEKQGQMLQAEYATNAGNTDLVYQDSLQLRQDFCDLVNAIFGIGIWCEASEIALGQDTNFDGKTTDEKTPYDEAVAAQEGGMVDET